ncbi:MAG TPA: hypothetical protein VKV34_12170 [Thermoleophilia bacterium]|nr:hypothetical protein [Thermoleophilia bacterium]
MSASDLEWLAMLGLAAGGLGAFVASGRPSPPWLVAAVLGIAGALGGGYATRLVFGAGFPHTRRAIATITAVLVVGAYALYARSRRLPR